MSWTYFSVQSISPQKKIFYEHLEFFKIFLSYIRPFFPKFSGLLGKLKLGFVRKMFCQKNCLSKIFQNKNVIYDIIFIFFDVINNIFNLKQKQRTKNLKENKREKMVMVVVKICFVFCLWFYLNWWCFIDLNWFIIWIVIHFVLIELNCC